MNFLLRFSISIGLIAALTFLESSLAHTQQRQPASSAEKLDAVRERKAGLLAAITSLNKVKSCVGDGECEVVETGARLCGGPSGYMVISTSNPGYTSLKAKIKETQAVDKELNLLEPPGDCAPVPKLPEAKCVEQLCVAK